MAYNVKGSSGNLVLLSSQTASVSSAINFTSLISSTYDLYYFVAYGVFISDAGQNLFLQFSTDNGSSYSSTTYQDQGYRMGEDNSFGGFNNSSTGFQVGWSLNTNGDASPLTIEGKIFNASSSSLHKTVMYQSHMYSTGGGGGSTTHDAHGFWETTTAANAIRFVPSTGTITSGKFKLYGIQN